MFVNCWKSAVGFFKESGISPVVTDKLTIQLLTTNWDNPGEVSRITGKQPLRTDAGGGSRQQDLLRLA